MAADARLDAVIDRPQVQGRLQGAKAAFHLKELAIAEGGVLGRQGVVRGGDQVLAIQAFRGPDLGGGDHGLAPAPLAQIGTIALVVADALDSDSVVLGSLRERAQIRAQGIQRLLPPKTVSLGLVGVADQDEAAARLSAADDDLLDLDVVLQRLEPSRPGQGLLDVRLA